MTRWGATISESPPEYFMNMKLFNSTESTVVLVEYPPGDSWEYTLESQPQTKWNLVLFSEQQQENLWKFCWSVKIWMVCTTVSQPHTIVRVGSPLHYALASTVMWHQAPPPPSHLAFSPVEGYEWWDRYHHHHHRHTYGIASTVTHLTLFSSTTVSQCYCPG